MTPYSGLLFFYLLALLLLPAVVLGLLGKSLALPAAERPPDTGPSPPRPGREAPPPAGCRAAFAGSPPHLSCLPLCWGCWENP